MEATKKISSKKRKAELNESPVVSKKKGKRKSSQAPMEDSKTKKFIDENKTADVEYQINSPREDICVDVDVKAEPVETAANKHSNNSEDKLAYFIGNLPGAFTAAMKKQLIGYFEEEGIEIEDVNGLETNKFCHCTLTDPKDMKKIEALNLLTFKGSALTIDRVSKDVSTILEQPNKPSGNSSGFRKRRVTFTVSNLSEPLSDYLKQQLVTFFKKNDIKLEELRGLDGKWSCDCVLANPEDKEKMEEINGFLFRQRPLRIVAKEANTNAVAGNEVTVYDVDYNRVEPEELFRRIGGQSFRSNQRFGLAFVWFNNQLDAATCAEEETLTINGCKMRLEIKDDEHQIMKHPDYIRWDDRNRQPKKTQNNKATSQGHVKSSGASNKDATKTLQNATAGNEVTGQNLVEKLKMLSQGQKDAGKPTVKAEEMDNNPEQKNVRKQKYHGLDFFIGNLPVQVNDLLKESLSEFLFKNDITVRSLRGKPRSSCCHCTIKPLDEDKMKALNGELFQGVPIKIELAATETVSGRKLVLFDIDPSVITAKRLKEKIDGKLTDAFIIAKKNMAFVIFEKEADARSLFSKGTLTIDGCEMRIDLAYERPKKAVLRKKQKKKKEVKIGENTESTSILSFSKFA